MASESNASKGSKKRGKEQKERRMKNFTSDELAILVKFIVKYERKIYGPESKNCNQATKRKILQRVADELNLIGVAHRTADQVRKRWTDLTRRTREKVAQIRQHSLGTGGGSPCSTQLTDIEEQVATVLRPEQTFGLQGVDSSQSVKKHSGRQISIVTVEYFCMCTCELLKHI